jgi:excisionase family DNA binding protein
MEGDMSPEAEYYSLEEAAQILGVNYQLIYKLVRSGELPAIRVGRVYRIAKKDFQSYLDAARTDRAAGGSQCASCGRTYESALSLKETCESCGAPICTDCAVRRGITVCEECGENDKKRSRKGGA